MRHLMWITALLVGAACTSTPPTSQGAVASCSFHADQASCTGEAGCQWYPGEPCKDAPYCPPAGACAETAASVTGEGTASAACTCAGGAVCFEQFGGPALPAALPAFRCTTHLAGSGDLCSRIQGQGRCEASTTVKGACTCDNGIR